MQNLADFITALVGAIGSIGAFVVALLIYREARYIRQSDWIGRVYEDWQSFNLFQVQSGFVDRWGDIFFHRYDETRLDNRD